MSTTNFQDLDPDSPEYDAAVEAAQAEEDAQREAEADPDAKPATDAEPKPDEQPTPEAEAEPAAVATEEPPAKVAGVASKDGSVVLPYTALQAERRNAKRERNAREQAERERDAIKQQLEDLKAGKKPEPELTDEEIADLAVDVPAVAKLAAERERLRKENEELAAKVPKPTTAKESDEEDPAEEAMYLIPELVTWRESDIEKFNRAAEYDAVLRKSPKWKDGDGSADYFARRYREAVRMVAAEYDLKTEDPPQPKPQSRPDPKKVIGEAERTPPQTLSDFKGGTADPTEERIDKLSPARMLDRFSAMTDEEIDAYLAKHG